MLEDINPLGCDLRHCGSRFTDAYRRPMKAPYHFFRRRMRVLRNLPVVIGVRPNERQIRGGAMRNYTRSIWTCAALYVAIGLIGIVFLTTRPGVATSNDGYGIANIAPQATPH